MNDKEYNKITADVRRNTSRKYGFRQSSYINFKAEGGYYFCMYFLTDEVRLTVKPMYTDELWWKIWDASENNKKPLSLRGTGAYSLSGQVLASFEILQTIDRSKLADCFERVFQDATAVISKFLTDNPNADIFYPDESKMDHDPDRLLYLIALVHNNRENEVLEIIEEARKNKHSCMFRSGMFGDSYTYIRRWCKHKHSLCNPHALIRKTIYVIKKFCALIMDIISRDEELLTTSIALHIGAGIRYGCLRLFRRKQKITYKRIRYGSKSFCSLDHADNNLVNGFLGFIALATFLLLVVKLIR